MAHFNIGVAIARSGESDRAILAFQTAMLLKHNYKVIFITRPIEEVVVSQRAMVNRLATKSAELDAEQLERGLRGHRNETLNRLKSTPHMELIEVDYPALVRDPHSVVPRITEFLGKERIPHPEKMAAVIDASLYRQKSCVLSERHRLGHSCDEV